MPERIIRDTAYGSHNRQKMDIYLPAGRNSRTRVIFMIHGGGWVAGDKSEFEQYRTPISQKWPEADIVNLNYRLATAPPNGIHYNKILSDIRQAVLFVMNNKNVFQISDTVAMMGGSAGGHLAMLYTYTDNVNNYIKCVGSIAGPTVLSDWDWYKSFNIWIGRRISELLTAFCGTAWSSQAITPLYESLSPYHRVTSTSKPTILFHEEWDPVVPFYQAQWMAGKLQNAGVPHQFHSYAFQFHDFTDDVKNDCVTKLVNFFKARTQ
ncbi:MAG: alpha/beta hydrolase [Chitinophagaceae bacterium]|nr:alpha/beta hydrolase [Chitinophagaceae bacterium]